MVLHVPYTQDEADGCYVKLWVEKAGVEVGVREGETDTDEGSGLPNWVWTFPDESPDYVVKGVVGDPPEAEGTQAQEGSGVEEGAGESRVGARPLAERDTPTVVETEVYVIKKLAIKCLLSWPTNELPSDWEGWAELVSRLLWARWQGGVVSDDYLLQEVPRFSSWSGWAKYESVGGKKAFNLPDIFDGTWLGYPNCLWWSPRLQPGDNRLPIRVSYRGVYLFHDCEYCHLLKIDVDVDSDNDKKITGVAWSDTNPEDKNETTNACYVYLNHNFDEKKLDKHNKLVEDRKTPECIGKDDPDLRPALLHVNTGGLLCRIRINRHGDGLLFRDVNVFWRGVDNDKDHGWELMPDTFPSEKGVPQGVAFNNTYDLLIEGADTGESELEFELLMGKDQGDLCRKIADAVKVKVYVHGFRGEQGTAEISNVAGIFFRSVKEGYDALHGLSAAELGNDGDYRKKAELPKALREWAAWTIHNERNNEVWHDLTIGVLIEAIKKGLEFALSAGLNEFVPGIGKVFDRILETYENGEKLGKTYADVFGQITGLSDMAYKGFSTRDFKPGDYGVDAHFFVGFSHDVKDSPPSNPLVCFTVIVRGLVCRLPWQGGWSFPGLGPAGATFYGPLSRKNVPSAKGLVFGFTFGGTKRLGITDQVKLGGIRDSFIGTYAGP